MGKGAESHGERNYQKGAGDPNFIRDRKNHLLEHAMKYAAGDTSDDHLAAVLANANICAWLEANSRNALSYDEKRAYPVTCHCGREVSQRCSGTVCAFEGRAS